MSHCDTDNFTLWAEFLTEAATRENPIERIVALLVEFEGQVYNRALNDVLMSCEKRNRPVADLVKQLQLSPCDLTIEAIPDNVIPFPEPA